MDFFKKLMLVAAMMTSFSVQAAPIFHIVELGVAPGQQQAFDLAGRENLEASVGGELGTLTLYAVSPRDNSSLAYLVEVYADADAYQAHISGVPYKTYAAKAPALLTDHKKLIDTDPVFLAEKPTPIRVKHAERTPIVHLVQVTLNHHAEQAFRRVVVDEMAQAMDKEPGVLAMYAASRKGQAETWYFVEIYADESAYETHRQTPHFQTYLKETASLVADKKLTEMDSRILFSKGGLYFVKP